MYPVTAGALGLVEGVVGLTEQREEVGVSIGGAQADADRGADAAWQVGRAGCRDAGPEGFGEQPARCEIGRASCRERV